LLQVSKLIRILGRHLFVLALSANGYLCAQAVPDGGVINSRPAAVPSDSVRGRNPAKTFITDEKTFWTSPFRIRSGDFKLLFPVGVLTTGLIATDADFVNHNLPTDSSTIRRAQELSDYGAIGFVALSGSFYLGGLVFKNDHARETGMLAGAAIGHSLVVNTTLKYATGRERPFTGNKRGDFWQGGDSFPSDHSAIAWSAASVIAHEYPGKLTQFLAYGGASAVSISRVIGQKHFPSDVFIGSTLGWLIGTQLYKSHHNPNLPGAEWGSFVPDSAEVQRTVQNMGSAYVPVESWVYDAFDQLAGLGFVKSAFPSIRPWTRTECVRLLAEAGEVENDESNTSVNPLADSLIASLALEFKPDIERIDSGANNALELESVYTRVAGISGTPLTDGYHFGQTIINDFGRPSREGFNAVGGLSGIATAGPLVLYARGEFQHSPSAPAVAPDVNLAIAILEGHPPTPSTPFSTYNQFRLIEAYIGVNLHNVQISFGRQSLWWGPGEHSTMLMGNNAEPFAMLRVDTVSPFHLPWIFKYFGPMHIETFFGQLSGSQFVNTETGMYSPYIPGRPIEPQPFLHGQKLSFKPTPNFTFSVSRTGIIGGPSFPLTPSRLWRSFVAQNNYFGSTDPGDNRGAVDMSYRIRGIRNWLTLYLDAFTEDQPTPLLFPERAAFRTGLYMPQFPGAQRLSIRAEAVVTDIPASILFPGYHYYNVRYQSGYTNRGNLMGTWVGRQGVGGQMWATYTFRPKNTFEVSYRVNRVSEDFLQGGTQNDIAAKTTLAVKKGLMLSAFLQYESWKFPLLSPATQSNFTSSIQLTWEPHLSFGKNR
jgi:membrane-associated phospholipid phosphatase